MREILAQLVDRARGSSEGSRFLIKSHPETSDNNKIAGNLLRLPARYLLPWGRFLHLRRDSDAPHFNKRTCHRGIWRGCCPIANELQGLRSRLQIIQLKVTQHHHQPPHSRTVVVVVSFN